MLGCKHTRTACPPSTTCRLQGCNDNTHLCVMSACIRLSCKVCMAYCSDRATYAQYTMLQLQLLVINAQSYLTGDKQMDNDKNTQTV
jgi:hypothetical protein